MSTEFDTPIKKRRFALSLKNEGPYAIYDSHEEDAEGCHWDDFSYEIYLLMEYLNPENKPWYVEGRNMGWRGLNGETTIELAGDHKPWDLLCKILPKTNQMYLEVTINLHEKTIPKSGFIIKCKHHDNPVNGDQYTVRVA